MQTLYKVTLVGFTQFYCELFVAAPTLIAAHEKAMTYGMNTGDKNKNSKGSVQRIEYVGQVYINE